MVQVGQESTMRALRVLGGLVGFGLWCAAGSVPAAAQTTSAGTITGRVTLESGGDPVHGATVIVIGARRQATTDETGKFEIRNVPVGVYAVLAQREHLTTARQTVTVEPGGTVALEFRLVVGRHEEVTVTASPTGAASTFEAFNAVTTLDSSEIMKRIGATLADVLEFEPGVAKRTFGPGTSRPIIRGFDGDRVLVMQDGMRTADLSSQSGDHGVSIDPGSLHRIEVVKGPATLLYGSNAVGGVVNAISPQDGFRSTPFSGTLGGLSFDGGTANGQAGIAGNVQHGRGPWLLYGGVTTRRTSDYDAPDETIPNSATRLTTGEGGVAWNGARGFVGVGAGFERNRYGVPFAGAFEGEEDAEIDLKVSRQNVRFDAGVRNNGGFAEVFRVTGNFVDYQHDELESEDGEEILGTRFTNRVLSLRAEIEQRKAARLGGRFGVEYLNRDYEAVGAEALTPPTTQDVFAAFAYEELSFGKHRVLFGGRFEHTGYDAADLATRSFNGASGSVGFHTGIGTAGAFVVNLTGSSRAPALEELFNNGPHIGNLLFEIGNADLEIERTMGIDASVRSRAKRARGEVNVFYYSISNFVFLDVTDEVEDGLNVAHYVQGDSRFVGAEAAGHFDLGGKATLNASIGIVSARLIETDEALPRIPPVQGRVSVDLPWRRLVVTPEVVFAGRQTDVFRNETPTDGWATFNLAATLQVFKGHQSHALSVVGYNLTNSEYRLHTSFIKDLAPEMGAGVKVTYAVRFF
jgi:iron complex outermembrane receptor protein